MKKRSTFREILAKVASENYARLKDRAFGANRVAKITVGPSRDVCYRVKSRAIAALLRHQAAVVNAIDFSRWEPEIGLTFVGGGKLHAKASGLDLDARRILQEQLVAAISGKATEHLGGQTYDFS